MSANATHTDTSPDQVVDRLKDAHSSWAMMGALSDDVGMFVLRERIRMAKKKRVRSERPHDGPNKKARPSTESVTDEAGDEAHQTDPSSAADTPTSGDGGDADRVKRMATLYVQIQRAHKLFQREIEQTMAEAAQASSEGTETGVTKYEENCAPAPLE